jgi:hypothetical protein
MASDSVCDRGVMLDSKLVTKLRIGKLTSTGFWNLWRLYQLCNVLLQELQNHWSFHPYCNAVPVGLSTATIAPLNRPMNGAAGFGASCHVSDHVATTFLSLHWLLISQLTIHRLCLLMYCLVFNFLSYSISIMWPFKSCVIAALPTQMELPLNLLDALCVLSTQFSMKSLLLWSSRHTRAPWKKGIIMALHKGNEFTDWVLK